MKIQVKTPGQTFEFTPGEGSSSFVVGKRKQDDVCVEDDPELSGPHVRIDRFGDKWSFTDQFSDAGTLHNGEKKYSDDLKVGDVLKLGQTELRVLEMGGQEAPAPDVSNEPPESVSFDQPEEKTAEKDDGEIFKLSPLLYEGDENREDEEEPYALEQIRGLEFEEPKAQTEKQVPEVFVDRIANRLAVTFEHRHGPIRDDKQAMQRIREAARQAVIELEDVKRTEVNLPFLKADADGPQHLKMEIERKHLHDEFGPSPVQQRELRRPPPVKPRPTQADFKRRRYVGIGIGIAIIAAILGTSFIDLIDLADTDEPAPDVASPVGDSDLISGASEDELLAQVKAMRVDDVTPPQQLLDRLDLIEAEARKLGYPIGWDYESARTIVETRVYSDVSQRYGDTSRLVGELHQEDRYREAGEAVDELVDFLDSSPHHKRAIKTIRIENSVERWRDTQTRKSAELVAENLVTIGETLSRRDYRTAHQAAAKIHDCAILDADVRDALGRYTDQLEQQAAEVEKAGLKPEAAFDRRTDKLPETPENSLLPNGDNTGWQYLRGAKWEFEKALRAGDLDGKQFELWGLTVRIEGDPKSSLVYLHYSMELEPGVTIEGVDRANLPNEHPRIELNVYLQKEDLTLNDLLALLVSSFHDGAMDEAGRIAFAIRELDESAREPLDEILGVKWGVPVPEGGFPERDGRVVPE